MDSGNRGFPTGNSQQQHSGQARSAQPQHGEQNGAIEVAAVTGVAAAAMAVAPQGQGGGQEQVTRIVPGPNNVVVLPADVSLQAIHLQGKDLVVDLPDGSKIVIVGGGEHIPQLVIGNVTLPQVNVAALLEQNGPEPAAGPNNPSSGGNFYVPPGDIGPA